MATVSENGVRAGGVPDGTVAVVHCPDYDERKVYEAVGRGLELLGGAGRFARAGEQLLLKVNMLAGSAPEKAVTTHPSVFRAVAQHFLACGARISYGDSPGMGRPDHIARQAALAPVAEELGIPLAEFVEGRLTSYPEGHVIRQFMLTRGVLECDGLISLPKLKSHALVRMTGAVKNQFGCIPGLLKAEFHARVLDVERFARMLVDLTGCVRPRLYICDAVTAMEGNGPRGGTARHVGTLLLSTDPVALDAVACRIIALRPELLLTNLWGQEMGLGSYDRVTILGDAVEPLVVQDFKVNRTPEQRKTMMSRFLGRLLKELVVPRPVIAQDRCTHCGACVKICPVSPKALGFTEGTAESPQYNYKACIRCYCCQELCPEKAISVRTPPLGRLVH